MKEASICYGAGSTNSSSSPIAGEQLARFFHADVPDLQHLFVRTLIDAAPVSIFKMSAERFRIEFTNRIQVDHRLLFRGQFDIRQSRPRKILHPRSMRRDGIKRLDLGPAL